VVGYVEGVEPRRTEEDDRVLDAFAAEAGLRLVVLGNNAQYAAVGRVEELGVLVRERRIGKRCGCG
jgi:hypothetical protein